MDLLAIILSVSFFTNTVLSQAFLGPRNITVDDADPAIVYAGSGWYTVADSPAYDGSLHTTCANSTLNQTATFNFTGVAIYYVFPYHCASNTTLIVDGGDPVSILYNDLYMNGTNGIWGLTNLANGPHTIVNTGMGGADVARVDAFIYTVDDSEPVGVPPTSMDPVLPPTSTGATELPTSTVSLVSSTSTDQVLPPTSTDLLVPPTSSDSVLRPSTGLPSTSPVPPSTSTGVVLPSPSIGAAEPPTSRVPHVPPTSTGPALPLASTGPVLPPTPTGPLVPVTSTGPFVPPTSKDPVLPLPPTAMGDDVPLTSASPLTPTPDGDVSPPPTGGDVPPASGGTKNFFPSAAVVPATPGDDVPGFSPAPTGPVLVPAPGGTNNVFTSAVVPPTSNNDAPRLPPTGTETEVQPTSTRPLRPLTSTYAVLLPTSASTGAAEPSTSMGPPVPPASDDDIPPASTGGNVPPATAGTKNVFLSADSFAYSAGWAVSTDPVPNCVESGHVHQTSTVNSTFSFNFTGDSLYLNTLASPGGGLLSLSINGGAPEVFNITAPTASCALLSLNVTSHVKRTLVRRGDAAIDAQNQCIGKSVSGTTALDGATYQQASSSRRASASVTVFAAVAVVMLSLLI